MRLVPIAAALALIGAATPSHAAPLPPPTRVDVVIDTMQNVGVADRYRWLEDKDSPETRAWIATQQQYEKTVLDPVPGRDALRARFATLLKRDVVSSPIARAGRYFFTRRGASQDLSLLMLRDKGRDEVILDPHGLSADHSVSVGWLDVAPDGKQAAWFTRSGGRDEVKLTIYDVDKRAVVDSLPLARYFGIALAPDHRSVTYATMTPEGPRARRHVIGGGADDTPVFGDKYGPGDILDVSLASGSKWLIYAVYHGSSGDDNELWTQEVAHPEVAPVALVNDVHAGFFMDAAGDKFVVRTNWEAPNGRFFVVDPAHRQRTAWKEILPAREDAVAEDFALAGGKLLVSYLRNVSSFVQVFDITGKPAGDIPLPALGSVNRLTGVWDQPEAFVDYTSFLVPGTVYRWDATKGATTVWAQQKIPFDPKDYTVEQVWYASKDSTRIPMFLVHKAGLTPNGERPAYLTGYGGFDVSETPQFASSAVVWVEHGGVVAVPALRGGGEFGEQWHKAGMLGKKQNVFDDFIAAAQYLIQQKWTKPGKLVIEGGSNGGLLVGAAMTQHPELFRAVICDVPLLDMLRYHKFLVARFWIPEYGSSDDPQQFRWLLAYSPYHHVIKGTEYPAVMFVSGDSDTRVDPLHARKMTALMQASTGSDRPVILHYDTTSGHSSGKPVSKQIEDSAAVMQFALWQVGVTPSARQGTAAR